MIIDTAQGFMGGFNIHAESSQRASGQHRWRDTHLHLIGAIGKQLQGYFDDVWFYQRNAGPVSLISADNQLILLPNFNRRCRYLLRCTLIQAVQRAQHSVYITTPYFVPDNFLLNVLICAAKRGVAIRLLVPGESDHQIINVLAQRFYQQLLAHGIAVFEYHERMLHAKTLVVDKRIVFVGSANKDYRSLFTNLELTAVIDDVTVADAMTQQFLSDCRIANRLDVGSVKTRDMQFWYWRLLATLIKRWL